LAADLAAGFAGLAAFAGDRPGVTLARGLPLADLGGSVRAVTLPPAVAVALAGLVSGLADEAFDVTRLLATEAAAADRTAKGLAAAGLAEAGLTADCFCGAVRDTTGFVGAGLTALTGTTRGGLAIGPLAVLA
jgi:hypothetical protein